MFKTGFDPDKGFTIQINDQSVTLSAHGVAELKYQLEQATEHWRRKALANFQRDLERVR